MIEPSSLHRRSVTEVETKDRERSEQPWTSSEENVLIDICRECVIASNQHTVAERRCRLLNRCLTIPSVLIPVILEVADNLTEDTFTTYAFPIGMGTVAALNGLVTILAYGQRQEQHSNASHTYRQIADDIAILLNTPRRFRAAADTMLERYRLKFSHINAMAPYIPDDAKSRNAIRLPKFISNRGTPTIPETPEEKAPDKNNSFSPK